MKPSCATLRGEVFFGYGFVVWTVVERGNLERKAYRTLIASRRNPMILRSESGEDPNRDADGAAGGTAGRGGIRATWRRVREEDRAIHENDERLLVKLLAAMHVVWRLLPIYLVL